jgi:hypothetical protein
VDDPRRQGRNASNEPHAPILGPTDTEAQRGLECGNREAHTEEALMSLGLLLLFGHITTMIGAVTISFGPPGLFGSPHAPARRRSFVVP